MFFMHGIHIYFTMFFCLRPMNPTYEKSKIIFRLNRCMFLAHPRFVQGRLRGWWWHSRRPEDRPKMAGMGRMGCIKPSGKPWETQFKADVFLNEQFHQSNFRLIYIYIQYITTVYIYSIHLQYIFTNSSIITWTIRWGALFATIHIHQTMSTPDAYSNAWLIEPAGTWLSTVMGLVVQ